MQDGVFCVLSVDFASSDSRDTFLKSAIVAREAELIEAGVVLEDSELFGSEVSVAGAKSLKDALAKLEDTGLEIDKRDVATWEKTKGEVRIRTKGELARDATVKVFVAWLKKRAKEGETFFAVSDTKKQLAVIGYLSGYDEYCMLQPAFFFAVAAARAAGARARTAFWADVRLRDPAVHAALAGDGDALEPVRFDEPQNIAEEDAASIRERFALDFDRISAEYGKWLDAHEEKKILTTRAGKAGYVRADGTFAVEAKYPALATFNEGLAAFKDERRRWGYVDENGVEMIPATFVEAQDFKNGRARVRHETAREQTGPSAFRTAQKYGFVDRTGAFVIAPTFDAVESFSEGRAMFTRDCKHGYIDESGAERIPPTFDCAQSFACGRALVCVGDRQSGKWGFIDADGAWVIEPRFRCAGSFVEGYAPFIEGDRWGLIDTSGAVVLAPRFLEASFAKDGRVLGRTATGHGVTMVAGEVVVPHEYVRVAERGEIYEAMVPDMTRALYDRSGRRIGALRVADNGVGGEGLVPIQRERGGPWEYVDLRGDAAIDKKFRNAFGFGQGHAIVLDDTGLGIIDRGGAIVARPALEPQVRDATPFSKAGLARIELYQVALVALDGRVVIGRCLSGVHDDGGPLVWVKYAEKD